MELEKIGKVLAAGRGSVGITEGLILQKHLGRENFAFLASGSRKNRYEQKPLYVDGVQTEFRYTDDPEEFGTADLVLIASKYGALPAVMEEIRPFIDEKTILMSCINGIASEDDLRKAFPDNPIIRTIAQKMDSVYCESEDAYTMNHSRIGELVFGQDLEGQEASIARVRTLFDEAGLPYILSDDILYDQWSKLMLNCGINQVCAAFDVPYGEVVKNPKIRRIFIEAMQEVKALANARGIALTEDDIDGWVDAVAALGHEAMPSMLQDVRAHRKTELGLFAGTVIPLGQESGLQMPVQDMLYKRIFALDESLETDGKQS